MAEKSTQKKARRIAAVLIALMGVLLLQDRVGLLLAGRASTTWPTITATVTEASVAPPAGVQLGQGWRVQVAYEYGIDGEVFTGSRLRFTRSLGRRTREQADQHLASFIPGEPIEVHYDPENPDRSVVMPGADRRAWFGLVVSVVLLLIAAVFWTVPTRSHSTGQSRDDSG